MPRKVQTVAKNGADDGEGSVGAFLDALPGVKDPQQDEDEDDDEDDDDDDDDGGDDDDGDDEDDEDDADDADDDDGGEPMPIAASVLSTLAPPPAMPPVPASRPARKPRASNAAPVTPVSSRPRGVRGPRAMTPEQAARSPALNAARSFQESAYQEVDSLLASLNFATRDYEIRVERLEPDFDENDTPCSGHLADYKDKVTVGDIRRRFGGGTYYIKIFGPHPTTGRPGIIKQEKFKIAGPPKPMKSEVSRQVQDKVPDQMSEVLKTIAETNERSQRRVIEVLERTRDAQSGISEILPVITPLIEKFLSKGDEDRRLILEAQREERVRDEERRREERQKEEDRRSEQKREEDKKETQRREDERRADEKRRDDERRSEEARREQLREEREAAAEARREERERAKEERERLREEMRNESAEKQRQHERDLAAQMERSKQDQQRQTEFMSMMQNFQQAQMDAMQSRAENGGIKAVTEQLLMLKNLSGTLTGSDQEPTSMEKFTEGMQNMVTTVMPVAQQLIAARRPQVVVAQPQVQQAPSRPIVVDLGPQRAALPRPNPAPAAPSASTAPAATSVPTGQATGQADGLANDLTEFAVPSSSDDMLSAGTLLIKNVDLAVQRNLSPKDVVEKILGPFDERASVLMSMASGMSPEELIEFIAGNVPGDWAILSPRGEELVTKAFELWQAESEAA